METTAERHNGGRTQDVSSCLSPPTQFFQPTCFNWTKNGRFFNVDSSLFIEVVEFTGEAKEFGDSGKNGEVSEQEENDYSERRRKRDLFTFKIDTVRKTFCLPRVSLELYY